MSSSKNWPVKRLSGWCLSVWGPEPHAPPPYTLYTCIKVYLFTKGKGEVGRVEPERRLDGQQFTKLGRKYKHDWLYLQSINSAIHLPHSSPFTGKFFGWWHIGLLSYSLLVHSRKWLRKKKKNSKKGRCCCMGRKKIFSSYGERK
jgi:hypothetical protein